MLADCSKVKPEFSALMEGKHGIDNPKPNSYLALECSI